MDRVCARLSDADFEPALVSVRPRPDSDVPVLLDRYDRGPLGAVRTITEARAGPFLLVGGDMPFLSVADLRGLRERYRPGTSVVPRWADGALEVLHAVYDITPPRAARAWERGASLRDLARSEPGALFPAAEEFDPYTFIDIDTPADWERWRDGPRRAGSTDAGTRPARR